MKIGCCAGFAVFAAAGCPDGGWAIAAVVKRSEVENARAARRVIGPSYAAGAAAR
jgi:hypothetical protein